MPSSGASPEHSLPLAAPSPVLSAVLGSEAVLSGTCPVPRPSGCWLRATGPLVRTVVIVGLPPSSWPHVPSRTWPPRGCCAGMFPAQSTTHAVSQPLTLRWLAAVSSKVPTSTCHLESCWIRVTSLHPLPLMLWPQRLVVATHTLTLTLHLHKCAFVQWLLLPSKFSLDVTFSRKPSLTFLPLCSPNLWAYDGHNPKDKHTETVCLYVLFPIPHQIVSFLRLGLIPCTPSVFPRAWHRGVAQLILT